MRDHEIFKVGRDHHASSTSPANPACEAPTSDASCCCTDPNPVSHAHEHQHGLDYLPTLASLLLLLSGILLSYLEVAWFVGAVRLIWFAAAYIPVGGKVLLQAARSIARGDVFNEFFLMGIATLGAFYIGEYAEGVAVMLFYVIGEHFQDSAVQKSRKSIKDLIDNRPDVASVFRDGRYREVHPSAVAVGETIRLRAGDKVPLDGILTTPHAYFKTDALTGESMPRSVKKGERILAGMVNQEKVVEMETTAIYEDSTLSKILRMVEQAGARKAKTQRFITKFAKVYTPVVVFMAMGLTLLPYFFVDNYVFQDWLYRALVFLVISCPCALVVSIPLGYYGGIGAASQNGILFKGSNFLDLITQADVLVMDKTGTLTEGIFSVKEAAVLPDAGMTEKEMVQLAAAMENHSTHPIAKAVQAYANDEHATIPVEEVEELPGFGLKGTINGQPILVGNPRLLDKYAITYPAHLSDIVDTLVVVAIDGTYIGHMTIADRIKEGTIQSLKKLRTLNIKKMVMLSGDRKPVVNAVARELGMDEAHGELLPQDKVRIVEDLKQQGHVVAFVGDGVNDAPVISLADIGIAMGGLGSDAAIETADVVIQNDQPAQLVTAIRIGRKTKQGVWQNIALAFGVKAIVLVVGAFGVASLWEAVFADVGVALLAIFNAMRIQNMKFNA
ncbi:MAG TPA: heavy metal translocating P-type ATPase [Cyclobacteriaceae bacterium]|nr:heavy metal translocating P-type ATPase [Cyclobacteriaceae bacterium]